MHSLGMVENQCTKQIYSKDKCTLSEKKNSENPIKNLNRSPVRKVESPVTKLSSSSTKNVSKKVVVPIQSSLSKEMSKAKKNDDNLKHNVLNDTQYSLWVEKYKPTSLKQIIGQQGEKRNVNKLVKWLKNWHSNQSGKKKLSKPR